MSLTDTIKPEWPADAVERRAVASLVPYARNARSHSAAQVAQIAASIREWGFTNPVLVDEACGIIAGHGRVLAAQLLGLAELPVMVAHGWTAAQKRAYVLADNKLTENAGWNDDMLRVELTELQAEGFDLQLTGFSGDELAGLLDATEGLTDPDEVPELPAAPVTRAGDVWLLGRHRLMCGDSTNPLHIDALMAGQMADLCFTSPPYGQQRVYKAKGSDWDELMQGVFGILPVKHAAQVLVNLGMIHKGGEVWRYWDGWLSFMRAAGWRLFGWYVWDQGSGFPGAYGGRCAPAHELIFHLRQRRRCLQSGHAFVLHFNRVAGKAAKTMPTKTPGRVQSGGHLGADGWVTDRASTRVTGQRKIPDSVWRINRRPGDGSHPAIFPVALPERAFTTWPGQLLFEPFSGSGTSIIAAQMHGRACFAMELAPAYCDLAVQRWQAFTGQAATLQATGQPFDGASHG